MVSVEEALKKILDHARPLEPEAVSILQALDKVLAEDIHSDMNIPPLDNSAMDGYAVRAKDIQGASQSKPVELTIPGETRAGQLPEKPLGLGEAMAIMTGAPIPPGADAVVIVEDTERADGKVRIFEEARKGDHIRLAGEDIKKGELVLKSGKVLGPAEIGMMAAVGCKSVSTVRSPVVAILATGDEIVDVGEELLPGKIRNSNSYSLAAQVERYGATPQILGIAQDVKGELKAKVEEGLKADVLLTSGGVSMGKYDLVRNILGEVGQMIFWKVAMRPGKPLAFGVAGNKLLFGLPGNPTSSMVSFEQFVRPALLKMQGRRRLRKREVKAKLAETIKKRPDPRVFLRVVVEEGDDGYLARPTGPQGSGILKSMVLANGLLVLPEGVSEVKAGQEAIVQLLDEPEVE